MYFESRAQAGQLLAAQVVDKYRYENCAVVALTEGGVLVGEQIAAQLHCVLMMLVTENIDVPDENLSFGAVSQRGNFTYNSEFSTIGPLRPRRRHGASRRRSGNPRARIHQLPAAGIHPLARLPTP